MTGHEDPRDREVFLSPGDLVAGKYIVDSVIGMGAAGYVVAAHHPELRQRVAVKLLRASRAGHPSMAERMMREARAVVGMQSEHVVRVMDVGRDKAGLPFLVMEHLQGFDLSEVLKQRKKLPIEEAVDYVLQACDAIAEAHARGIVHRDLKPGNLFLTKRIDGSPLVKVLDFGISKATSLEPQDMELSLTETAAILGSPTYMSPEQVRSAKRVDHRTDIWALGVILFKLVGGDAPFVAETFSALCAAIIADSPGRLRDLTPEVPEGLERAVQKCLEKDPLKRWNSIAELAEAIAPYGSDRGRASIQRIVRAVPAPAASGDAFDPSEDVVPPRVQLPSTLLQGAHEAHEASLQGVAGPQPKPRRGLFIAGFVGIALVTAGGVVVYKMSAPRPPKVEAAAQPPPPQTATTTAAPAASSSPPPAALEPSAKPSATSTAKKPPKPAAVPPRPTGGSSYGSALDDRK
jgi:serine/threonine-protein kinase